MEVEVIQVLLAAFASGNPRQRIQLDTHRDVARHGVEKFEELHFSVFQRRVRHVVDERDPDALLLPVVIVERYHRLRTPCFCPARRNSASF